ncbi:hypothetical protein [Erwinia mallotivora]|uniref:hypothetical protein n=1 Tax=Erwinia mallotivora TaxID=69222 RepID=UPI0021BE9A05|nr:hypothetical protein [Erwinia mallotivora]
MRTFALLATARKWLTALRPTFSLTLPADQPADSARLSESLLPTGLYGFETGYLLTRARYEK